MQEQTGMPHVYLSLASLYKLRGLFIILTLPSEVDIPYLPSAKRIKGNGQELSMQWQNVLKRCLATLDAQEIRMFYYQNMRHGPLFTPPLPSPSGKICTLPFIDPLYTMRVSEQLYNAPIILEEP